MRRLELLCDGDRALDICRPDGRVLWRYVYAPSTPPGEAPRPYAHPVYSPAGDVLTNFRPSDHPWHHGLSLTLTSVDGVNFWGGPTHAGGTGYRWLENHGCQVHRTWERREPEVLDHTLEWCEPRTGRVLLSERRRLQTTVQPTAWTLRWTSQLTNAEPCEVTLGNYHALGGLAGSHYTGLQFRGARGLLDDHGDVDIDVFAEDGRRGETSVHGVETAWIEWRTQHDATLNRTRLRFENLGGPAAWFVRRQLPLVAFAFHREKPHVLRGGGTLLLDHALTFAAA